MQSDQGVGKPSEEKADPKRPATLRAEKAFFLGLEHA